MMDSRLVPTGNTEASGPVKHHPQWESLVKVEERRITEGQAQRNFSQCLEEGNPSVNEHIAGGRWENRPRVRAEDSFPRGNVHRQVLKDPSHTGAPTGKRKYTCADCGKSFRWNSRLIAHRRLHTGEKPFQCTLCGKRFRRNAHLYQHHRTHTGEKPFECYECGKSFNDRSSYMKHGRTHTGDKPYHCLDCGKCFSQSAHLYRHHKTHMGEKL